MFDYLKNRFNEHPRLYLEDCLNEDCLYVKYTEAPFLMLPKTIEDYKGLHKRKFWYNIRRNENLFQNNFHNLHFKIIKDEKNLEFFLDQVFLLFNQRWSKEYTSSNWKNKISFNEYKKAMIELALVDSAFLAVLYDSEKKLLSYGYCLSQDDTVFFYQHSTSIEAKYRKYSLGRILIHYLLEYAVRNKYKKFDFMAGDSSYKYEWAKDRKIVYRLIGEKRLFNYLKMVIIKLRYFLQFNFYTRRVLKIIFYYMERFFEKS